MKLLGNMVALEVPQRTTGSVYTPTGMEESLLKQMLEDIKALRVHCTGGECKEVQTGNSVFVDPRVLTSKPRNKIGDQVYVFIREHDITMIYEENELIELNKTEVSHESN